MLKVKIGGAPIELDVGRLFAIAAAAPEARSRSTAARASARRGSAPICSLGLDRSLLGSRPVRAADPQRRITRALAAVRRHGRILVAADKSERSARDVAKLASLSAVGIVIIKITKTGIAEALDMIGCARSHRLGLMVGGSSESISAQTHPSPGAPACERQPPPPGGAGVCV